MRPVSPEFRGVMPEKEKKDISLYLAARHRMAVVAEQMPGHLKPSLSRIASIQFCTDREFYQMHLEDDLAHGMSQEEAEEVARRTSSEHMATMFELSGRIGVRQLPKEVGHALGSKEAKVQQYTQLIAHELGHDLLPIYNNVSFTEAAACMYLGEEQFQSMVSIELEKDPYLLLRYVEEDGGDPEAVLQGLQREAKTAGVSRVTLLRSKLIQNRRNVFEQLGIEHSSYQQHIQEQLEYIDLTLHGRGVTIVHRELGVQIGEMAHNNSRFLKEVSADGYALYTAYLEWLQGGEGSSTHPEQTLQAFRRSEAFREMIAPDDLTLVSIMDAVLAFGSFERFLETMLQTLDARAEVKNEVSGRESEALRCLAETSQMAEAINQVMFKFTQDPGFSMGVNRAFVKIVDQRSYAQILAAERKSKTRLDASFHMLVVQAMQTRDIFEFLALVIRAAKEVDVKGVKEAAAGGRTARETWTIKGSSDESGIPSVEQQFNAAISDLARVSPEKLLEKAARTLEYVGRVKASKK